MTWLPDIEIVICKKLFFKYTWLPIVFEHDLTNCQDMLNKLYNEWLFLTQTHNMVTTPTHDKKYAERHAHLRHKDYVLDCWESQEATHLQVEIHQLRPAVSKNSPFVQMYVGPYLIFCSQRDLPGLSSSHYTYVTSYILQKMAGI